MTTSIASVSGFSSGCSPPKRCGIEAEISRPQCQPPDHPRQCFDREQVGQRAGEGIRMALRRGPRLHGARGSGSAALKARS